MSLASKLGRVAPPIKEAADRTAAACRSARIPLRMRLAYWVYYFGLAHRGKQLHSKTHDAVYADGFWKRGYDKACARINRRLAQRAGQVVEAPRFYRAQLTDADMAYLTKLRIPYVLANGAAGLPVKDWTLDYLDAVGGDCDVPINAAPDAPSDDTSRPTKASRYYDFHTGPLRTVTESIRAGGPLRTTVAEDVMHLNDERLMKDLDIPGWERVTGWARNQHHWLRAKLFVGKIFSAQLIAQPANAFTLWHAEPGDSFFVLVTGEKVWTLAHPVYTAALKPRVKTTTNYTGSNIDIRESDAVQRQRGFDGYLGMPKVRARLEPGDMLRVPNFWWHTVVTAPGSHTIAATMRLEPGPNLVAPAMLLMRLFDKQTHALMKAYQRDGRIYDDLIGYPRKSRAETDATAGDDKLRETA